MQQGPVLVLVAHSGRTLQLDVTTTTQVALVQHALVSFTGVPVADQIAMYQGARLDPNKPLAAYGLPKDPATGSVEDHPVFLYCRSYLKPGAALPPPEALPQIQVQVPPLAEVNLAHPLHAAASPLVRALPDYERHFTHHLATTRAYWDVAQARLARCRQLLSEQEVQARAADAARANVEAHYNYILTAYQNFLDKYNAQHAAHALLLSTFPSDLAALDSMELHPTLQAPAQQHQHQHQQRQGQQQGEQQQQQQTGQAGVADGAASPSAGGAAELAAPPAPSAPPQRRLGDLYPVARLREWADTCARSHASFGGKVGELEALFQALRRDVEALFMQAPSVDLDALGRRMTECEGLLDEHSSMVQVLSKDLRTVRALVEDVVRQLGAAGGAGSSGAAAAGGGGIKLGALHDAAAALEAIHETHRNRVLPRLAALDSQLAEFAQAAEASKVAMSADVLGQLQRISGQQSRIRDMKNKLAAFNEVLARQDAAFSELKAVHRLPAAYRALLAEVVRRGAWQQLYCGQAGRLAEHMTRFREKEAARRAAFGKEVARYLPTELLTRAGLAAEPPHCQVTVPPPAVPLIAVGLPDLQRLSYLDERMAASSSLRAATAAAAAAGGAGAGAGGGGGGRPPHASHHHHHPHGQHQGHGRHGPSSQSHHTQQHGSRSAAAGGAGAIPGTVAVLDADPPPPADPMQALEMENARLRAELANHIAAACVRELESMQQPTTPATPARQQSTDSSTGTPPASAASASAALQLPQRVPSSGGGAAASGAASPAAGSAPARRDPAELVAAMQRALAMKDDLIRQQQRESATLSARAAAYEERIAALEALLARQASSPEAAVAGGIGSGRNSLHGAEGADAAAAAGDAVYGSAAEDGVVVERAVSGPGLSPLPSGVEVVEAATELARSGAAAVEEGAGADALAATRGGDTSNSVELVEREEAVGAEDEAAGMAKGEAAGMAEVGQETAEGELAAEAEAAWAPAPVPVAPSPFALAAVQDAPQPEGPIAAAALAAAAAAAAATASAAASATASAAPSQPASRRTSIDKSRALAVVALEGRARTQSASFTDAATSVAAAIARHAALAPVRGTSGPQAIPGRTTGGGGLAAAHASPGGAGRYGGSCMPMAIGSLPFATSLPAASLLPGSVIPGGGGGRLDASPSGGIGLGLALGFGLGPLTEATEQRRQRSGVLAAADGAGRGGVTAEAAAHGGSQDDEDTEEGAGALSTRSSMSGGSISASGSFCRAASAAAGEGEGGRAAEDGERAGGAGGDGSPVGGSSSSSSALQFRPSWSGMAAAAGASAPASGEAGQGDGKAGEQAQAQAPLLGLAGDVEQAADAGVAPESAEGAGAAALAGGEGLQAAAGRHHDGGGQAHDMNGEESDDAEAPDIDEVIDSGGAWGDAAGPGAMELVQEGEADAASGSEAEVADAVVAEPASSGYETVGSVADESA